MLDHVDLRVSDRAASPRFYTTVLGGYTSDGEPGPRPQYAADSYGGFLLDPDGNNVEAVNHNR